MLSQILILASILFAGSNALAQEIVRPPEPPHPRSIEPADQSAQALFSPFSPAADIVQSWEGMAQVGTIRPPDPHGAAGPSGVIATVNLRITYHTKTGSIVWGPLSLSGASGFWGGVGNTGSGNSDPRALYDPATGRFFVIMQENTSLNQAFLNLAVSKNSNPTTSDTTDWHFYRLNITQTVGATNYGADYPGMGIDSQAVYVTFNMYSLPFSTGVFKNCQIIILKKADIIAGTGTYSLLYTPDDFTNAFTLQPATVLSTTTPGNKVYFGDISFANTTSVRVWSVSDPLGTPSLSFSTVTVPNHGGSTGVFSAPQSGTSTTIATLTPRTQGNAFWHNGSLWFCHTAGGGSGKSSVYYYKVATNNFPSGTPTLTESGFINGGTGVWTYQGSIGGNANGDVALVYTQSSSSTFPTIMFTTRLNSASSFDAPQLLKASPGFSNSDRWGDYASVTADPVDNTFWLTHEWAKTTASHNWSTWWGNVALSPVPVQLASFTGTLTTSGAVQLEWMTLSEINNYGFEVQRGEHHGGPFETIAGSFVPGHGTTLEPRYYTWTDMTPSRRLPYYRLKQIDLGGTIHYFEPVFVSIVTRVSGGFTPAEYVLQQNYPNPFNPETVIRYGLPEQTHVRLEVFNALGQRVASLVNASRGAGYHEVTFDAGSLASGVYVYRLSAGGFVDSKRLVLVR